jgi:hypothetical protein
VNGRTLPARYQALWIVGSDRPPIVVSSSGHQAQEHEPMRYMMFVVVDPDAAAEAEPSEDELAIEEWLADVDGRGKRITGDALRPVSDATTVRVSRGQVLVTDGPFTESKDAGAGGRCDQVRLPAEPRPLRCLRRPGRSCVLPDHLGRRPGLTGRIGPTASRRAIRGWTRGGRTGSGGRRWPSPRPRGWWWRRRSSCPTAGPRPAR